MTYVIVENTAAYLPIANTDSGFSDAGGTTIVTPPNRLGAVVRANDPTYGGGEFIFLQGVASTVVGSVVEYDGTTYATTLCPATANLARPIAVAMAACNTTTLYGWYQIGGTAVALKGTASIQPKVAVAVTTTGKIGNTATGKEIESCRSANAATLTSAITSITLILDRPHMQGRIT
jgi:hypothetical protein